MGEIIDGQTLQCIDLSGSERDVAAHAGGTLESGYADAAFAASKSLVLGHQRSRNCIDEGLPLREHRRQFSIENGLIG